MRKLMVLVALVLACVGLGGAMRASAAWELNKVQLDSGICGANLQLGADKTASSAATPTFLLYGEGASARYDVAVDGIPLGTFVTDNYGNTCIAVTSPLAEGPHRLTASELAPNPTNTVAPFDFSVDTIPPAPPSTPAMIPFADTGVAGDNISRFSNNGFTGTAAPGIAVQLYANGSTVGGANADTSGAWFVATTTLNDGTYSLHAVAFDEAGNSSTNSGSVTATIDATPPVVTVTPASGAVVSGVVNASANITDAHAMLSVAFAVDGTTVQTGTGTTYSWDTTRLADGSHTLAVMAQDIAGNTTTKTSSVSVVQGSASLPGAPTLNAATAGNGSVDLGWTAPTNDGGSAVTGFVVYRGTTSGGEAVLANVTGTTYHDAAASNGTTYFYKVAAVNGAGTGPASAELSATPTAPAGRPDAPTFNVVQRLIVLSWSAPAHDGGSPITGFRIYRRSTGGSPTLIAQVDSATLTYETTSTQGDVYSVGAVNALGESVPTAER